MAAYAIVDVEIFDIGDYMDYLKRLRPLLRAAGGRYLARGGEFHVLEGDYQPDRLVLIEFPSLEALEDFYASQGFQELKSIRDRCSNTRLVALQGL